MNTKQIISLLDIMEEYRDLTLEEWIFRRITQNHLTNLLHQQHVYWKQRGTIKWVKFGDECTEFFHATATVKHRRSTITTLQDGQGQQFTTHEDKATLLWESYKERLGTSEATAMIFDIQDLLQPHANLEDLNQPFSQEEIDGVVSNMPTHKFPGPNGFNTDFLKRCWPLIKQDFYDLCQGIYDESICLQSINGSYITLVPKVEVPVSVGDLGPFLS